MLGIPNYKPNFAEDTNVFLKIHKDRFDKLIGNSISKFWVMWDDKENKWFPDGPIILEIDDDKFEFCAYQLDQFSLTINTINLSEKLDWYGMGKELPLSWKLNGKEEMINSLNRAIKDVNILTYNFKSKNTESGEPHETGFMMHGIEFEVNGSNNKISYFSIFNGLDKNGLTNIKGEQDDQIKRVRITGYSNK